MISKNRFFCISALLTICLLSQAQVPSVLNFQGRLVVGSGVFEGTGQFKFAVVSLDGSQTFWRNAPDNDSDGEPDDGVSVPVTRGLYSILLGDTQIPNMAALSPSVFDNGDVALRVWFSDGVSAVRQLIPDQRVASVGFALMAADVSSLDAARITTGVLPEQRLPSFLSNVTLVSDQPNDPALTSQGFVSFMRSTAPVWETSAGGNAPSPRFDHTAVWTGRDMIVWGGSLFTGSHTDSGSLYRPEFDEWTTISPINAPTARSGHVAVWTGEEMILWGGSSRSGFLNTGARFNVAEARWDSVSFSGAPVERNGHVAVWTGEKMIVWGGRNGSGLLKDGGVYDPAADQWSALSLPGSPAARADATAVWAGDRMIVWGGTGAGGLLDTGSQLKFDANGEPFQWAPTTTVGTPEGRVAHGAVWAGDEMIVWGGQGATTLLSDGVAYDPEADSWTVLESNGAPTARRGHISIWLGQEQDSMVVVGGETDSGASASGAAYDIGRRTWRPLTLGGDPVPRSEASVVWTGSDLIIFGGKSNGNAVGGAQRLNPQPDWYFYRKP